MGKRKNATEEFEDVDEPEIEDEEEEQHSSDISPPIIREFTEVRKHFNFKYLFLDISRTLK